MEMKAVDSNNDCCQGGLVVITKSFWPWALKDDDDEMTPTSSGVERVEHANDH